MVVSHIFEVHPYYRGRWSNFSKGLVQPPTRFVEILLAWFLCCWDPNPQESPVKMGQLPKACLRKTPASWDLKIRTPFWIPSLKLTYDVDGSEIRRTSWGNGSLSHYLQVLYIAGGRPWDFWSINSNTWKWAGPQRERIVFSTIHFPFGFRPIFRWELLVSGRVHLLSFTS